MRPFLLLAFLLASAETHAQDLKLSENTITVSGTGIVMVSPDRIALTIALESDGDTAGEALARHANEYRRVQDSLQAYGVPLEDIQAAQVAVGRGGAQYGGSPAEGYVAGRTFVVNLDDPDTAEVLLLAITADETENLEAMLDVGRREAVLTRFVDDPTPHEDEALAQAMRRALARARLAATAGGVEIGPVVAIYEQTGEGGNAMRQIAQLAAMQGGGGFTSGEVQFSAEVTVTFAIVNAP